MRHFIVVLSFLLSAFFLSSCASDCGCTKVKTPHYKRDKLSKTQRKIKRKINSKKKTSMKDDNSESDIRDGNILTEEEVGIFSFR